MRSWTALALRVPPSVEDDVLCAVHAAGTLGVHVESGERGEAQTIVAYFAASSDLSALRGALAALPGAMVLREEPVADEPWVERQEAARRPLEVGSRFLIVPAEPPVRGPKPREAGASSGGLPPRVVLVVPPKRAFGTGEHETTRQCLELLETVPVAGRTVLDLGTGSGILAMAAAAMGAAKVVGIDDDPEAIEMARENLVANPSAASSVALVVGREACLRGAFPLVLANIYARVLEDLAPPLSALQPRGGTAILSGFSPTDAEGVARAWGREGYLETRRSRDGEWSALILTKEAA